jgi:4-amino-4-deoxy-L-arabinose transferase-like glycosyltransferase
MMENMSVRLVVFKRSVTGQCVLLLGVVLLASALRFYKLGEWSFWLDELYTVRAARNISLHSLAWPRISVMLTGVALRVLGVNEWTARLAPALIGVVTIPLLHLPFRAAFGEDVALLSGLILAVSPWHIYWSQNARFYTSLLLLYTLALVFLYLAIERDRPWYIPISLFFLAFAVMERFTALFFVPVVASHILALMVLRFERPPGLRVRNLLLFVAPGVAFGFLEVYGIATRGSSTLTGALDTFVGKSIDDPVRILILVFFRIGIPLGTLAFFGGVYLLSEKKHPGLFLLVAALVPLIMLAAVNPFAFTVDRYVFVTLPVWIVLGATAVRELSCRARGTQKVLAVGLLAVLLGDAAGENLMYYQINHGNRPEWRRAFAQIQERRMGDDVVVSSVTEIATYYTGEEVAWLGDVDPQQLSMDGRRYWFVVDSEHSWWSPDQKRWVEDNSELVDVTYLRVRENINLRIYLFDPQLQAAAEQMRGDD